MRLHSGYFTCSASGCCKCNKKKFIILLTALRWNTFFIYMFTFKEKFKFFCRNVHMLTFRMFLIYRIETAAGIFRLYTVDSMYRGGTTWTGDFKCREVKTGFCRKRWTQTSSSMTFIGWKSGQTTFVPLKDRMEGAWLWTRCRVYSLQVVKGLTVKAQTFRPQMYRHEMLTSKSLINDLQLPPGGNTVTKNKKNWIRSQA